MQLYFNCAVRALKAIQFHVKPIKLLELFRIRRFKAIDSYIWFIVWYYSGLIGGFAWNIWPFFYSPVSCFKVCAFTCLSSTRMSLQIFCNKASQFLLIDMTAISFPGKFSKQICFARDYAARAVVFIAAFLKV